MNNIKSNINETNYYEKYIKYKDKYLIAVGKNNRNMYGGEPGVCAAVLTHRDGTREKCTRLTDAGSKYCTHHQNM